MSKQLFKSVLLDTTLLDINRTVPDILTPKVNTNAKNEKNEDFMISSIISTAVNFKVLCCFLICYIVFW